MHKATVCVEGKLEKGPTLRKLEQWRRQINKILAKGEGMLVILEHALLRN